MQCPTRDTEPCDYQQLYRKHVHENMMLHEKLKHMGTMEKSKLRMMQNESATFKNKYMKYMGSKKKSNNTESKIENAKQTQHRSAYLVCKDLAYSAKTWHDIVDVTKSELDIYKTEVLNNTVGERPERNKTPQLDIPAYAQGKLRRESSTCLPVIGSPGDKSHSRSNIRIIVTNDEVKTSKPGLDMPNLDSDPLSLSCSGRISSMSERTDAGDGFSLDPSKSYRGRSMSIDPSQSAGLLRRRRSSVRRSSSFNTTASEKRDNNAHLSPNMQSTNPEDVTDNPGNVTSVTEDTEDTVESNPSHARPFRRRSLTIDTAQLAARAGRRFSLRDRSSSDLNPAEMNWKILKKRTKMITASLSLLHDARDIEIEKTRRSFEDLSHCRYLRLADDKSYNEGRDNMTYSREKLNSDEDLRRSESSLSHYNQDVTR